jgi:acetolactate synthase-1/2/3 large subunit
MNNKTKINTKKYKKMNKTKKDIKHNFTFTQIFWDLLIKLRTTYIFGLPGGELDFLIKKIPSNTKWINLYNELQNGFVSRVYGNYKGDTGFLFLSQGPGFTTAISSLYNSVKESNPLLVFSIFDNSVDLFDFQSIDVIGISKQITKYVFIINNYNDIYKIVEAYTISKNQMTLSIVLINNKIVIGNNYYKKVNISTINSIIEKSNMNINSNRVRKSLKELDNTDFLVVLGKIKNNSYNTVINFIQKNNLPYVTSWNGRLIIKDTIYCGRIGSLGNHSANYALYNCKNLLFIGDFFYLTSNHYRYKFGIIFHENKKIISLSHSKYNLKHNNLHISFLVNNYYEILDNLHINSNKEWCNRLIKTNQILHGDLQVKSMLEKYAYYTSKVYKENNLNTHIACDVGNSWFAIGKYMDITTPGTYESSTRWASIGTGIANALGIYYATKKPVWCFVGDGALLWSSSNLLYLLNNPDLPITVFIFINNLYGAVCESFEIMNIKYNVSDILPDIPILKSLPNCHIFNDDTKYYNYLKNNQISNKLRFIILNLGNNCINSNVYEININKEYVTQLKEDDFNNIIKSKEVLVSEENIII